MKDRSNRKEVELDMQIVKSLRKFAHASHFRRAIYTMMAWSLTSDDRAELRDQFLVIDTQHNGTITHREIMRVLVENFHIDSEEAEHLFNSLDTDNDDEIAYSEFLAATIEDRIRLHEDVLRKTFSRFDSTQSGSITVDDLRCVLGDSFEGEDVADLIKEADADHDGSVSYDEFLSYFWKAEVVVGEPETPAGSPAVDSTGRECKRNPWKRMQTERLAEVLDGLIPEHFNDCSPTVGGGKTPNMRWRADRNSLRARTVPANAVKIPGLSGLSPSSQDTLRFQQASRSFPIDLLEAAAP